MVSLAGGLLGLSLTFPMISKPDTLPAYPHRDMQAVWGKKKEKKKVLLYSISQLQPH